MRGGARAWTWTALCICLFVAACGGDDDLGEPEETPDSGQDAKFMGIAPKEAGDVSSDAAADASAKPDTSRLADAAPETADASLDRAQSADARDSGRDAAPNASDASDARPQTPDAAPDRADAVATMDAPLDVTATEASSDALRSDASDAPNVSDAADATLDTVANDGGPGVDGSSDAAEASADDAAAAAGDGGDADAAQGDGGTGGLAAQSWQVGSGAVCSTLDPADCSDDPIVTNTFAIIEQANALALCSIGQSTARLWFAEGAAPAPGDYAVLTASSDADAVNVPAGQVVIAITVSSTTWWASSGTVNVALDGANLAITFQNVDASDGTNPTTLAGHFACMP